MNLQILRTDIALILTFVAGLFSVFHLNFNVADVSHIATDIVSFLFMAVPAALQLVRELQHLRLFGTPPSTPSAPSAGV